MTRQAGFIRRETSVLTGRRSNLEPAFALPDFPVFMGCTDQPEAGDVTADLSFSLCRDTGIVQLDLLPSLDLIYQLPHNDATGATWRRHHDGFAEFIGRHRFDRVLEIGAPTLFHAGRYRARHPDCGWTIVEPGPVEDAPPGVTRINDFFHDRLTLPGPFDAVIHSHVIEHSFDPEAFVAGIARQLAPGGRHLFSVPNLRPMLERAYTSCINFEHTILLADAYVDVMLARQGFRIEAKQAFDAAHSLWYDTVFTGQKQDIEYPNLYAEHRVLVDRFCAELRRFVDRANRQIAAFDGPVYLFGGHIFSQYLIGFGLDVSRVAGVLDNSPLKIGKRLYGTPFRVSHPEAIAALPSAGIVLKVEHYRDEIANQLSMLNPRARFIE